MASPNAKAGGQDGGGHTEHGAATTAHAPAGEVKFPPFQTELLGRDVDRIEKAFRRIAGRRWGLADGDRSIIADNGAVGEGSADINADQIAHGLLPSTLGRGGRGSGKAVTRSDVRWQPRSRGYQPPAASRLDLV